MQALTSHIIPAESRAMAALVKKQVLLADNAAKVILFGSRARGDAAKDSDWDFLVLTQQANTDALADKLRKIMLREVELKYDVAVSLIVKNEAVWQNEYAVTNIYESIAEEGILL
jgi:predicted nucleotidyltransferase